MTTQDHRQFSSDSSLHKKTTRRDLHHLTKSNCQVSPDRVVRCCTHEFPSAYDHSTQCWVSPQCTRTRTLCLSNQQTHSPSSHEVAGRAEGRGGEGGCEREGGVVVVVQAACMTHVSVDMRQRDATNWVAEHLGASSRRPRHPFPALMAGETPGRVPVYTALKTHLVMP